ncbi:MAG: EVE domain-containing protein [bacterium]
MPKRYWLFKTEESCYPIDALANEPGQTAAWDGVRNYQARNMLRDEIKKGDEAFFHHSSGKPTGIAGVVKIVKSGYPDHTAEDPNSQHPDPKHIKDNPIWYMVDVKLTRKFSEVIPLTTLKQTPGLENMMLCRRGSRLSVQPVRPEEWAIIMRLARDL